MTNEETLKRAEHARQLLSDPLIVEAFTAIKNEILSQWEECPVRDVEGREILWRYYKTFGKFKSIFEGAVENGKVASFRESQTAAEKTLNIFKGRKHA